MSLRLLAALSVSAAVHAAVFVQMPDPFASASRRMDSAVVSVAITVDSSGLASEVGSGVGEAMAPAPSDPARRPRSEPAEADPPPELRVAPSPEMRVSAAEKPATAFQARSTRAIAASKPGAPSLIDPMRVPKADSAPVHPPKPAPARQREGAPKAGRDPGVAATRAAPLAPGLSRVALADPPSGLVSGLMSDGGTLSAENDALDPRFIDLVRGAVEAHKRYPRRARRRGWEGRAVVEFMLHPDGQVSAVRVLSGSGHAPLDEAATAAVSAIAPLADAAGYLARERTLSLGIDFRLR
ncbi:MAG: TonB family protein [Gammaproteobacteria bacterium]